MNTTISLRTVTEFAALAAVVVVALVAVSA